MDAAGNPTSVAPLEYAPSLPRHRRRKSISRLTLLLAVGVIGFLAWQRGPAIAHRIELAYLQGRCLTFTPPSDVLVTKDKPFVNEHWRRFYQAANGSGRQSDGTLFVGRMRSHSGNERLVAVDCSWWRGISRAGVALGVEVWVPGSIARNPVCAFSNGTGGAIFPDGASLRLARIDGSDAAHIGIEAEHQGELMIVDGWLREDDSFVFERRSDRPIVPR